MPFRVGTIFPAYVAVVQLVMADTILALQERTIVELYNFRPLQFL
jgi:hypothetical protein